MSRLTLLALSALLAGVALAQSHTVPPVPADRARIHVIRPLSAVGEPRSIVFFVDGVMAVSLYDREYSWVDVAPGTHKIAAGTEAKANYVEFDLAVRSGDEHFVEYRQARSGYQQVRSTIRTIDPATARAGLESYKYRAK